MFSIALEVKLQCSPTATMKRSKSRMQDGAILQLRIHPPDSAVIQIPEFDEDFEGYQSSEAATSMPQTPTDTEPDYMSIAARIRESEPATPATPFDCDDDDVPPPEYKENNCTTTDDKDETTSLISKPSPGGGGPLAWIAASLLPVYTEKVPIPSDMNAAERAVCSFTFYNDLRQATHESHYEKVFERMQKEWTYIGGLVSLSSTCPGLSLITLFQLVAVSA